MFEISVILATVTAFFISQLFLCFRAKRIAVKLIPMYIAVFFLAVGTLMLLFVGKNWGIGFLGIMTLALVGCYALPAILAAWLIYFISHKIKTRKKAVTE